MKKNETFTKGRCDWRYNASCAADTNCFDDCPMPCPYDKRMSPCDMCKIKHCKRKTCEAKQIYDTEK